MLRTHNRTRMGSRRCRGEVWCDDNREHLNIIIIHSISMGGDQNARCWLPDRFACTPLLRCVCVFVCASFISFV